MTKGTVVNTRVRRIQPASVVVPPPHVTNPTRSAH